MDSSEFLESKLKLSSDVCFSSKDRRLQFMGPRGSLLCYYETREGRVGFCLLNPFICNHGLHCLTVEIRMVTCVLQSPSC